MTVSSKLAALGVVVAIAAIAAYALLLRVAIVRNHPRRWPAWLALGLTSLLLAGGAWFNFVAARVPDTPTVLRVGERPPDFTLSDAAGRDVSLSEYRGKKPVVIVFYRGYW